MAVRGVTIVVVAAVVVGLAACGGGSSRLGRATTSPQPETPATVSLAGVAAEDPGAGAVPTTQAPTTAPGDTAAVTAAPVTSAPCAAPAIGVLPSAVAGYEVVPDDSEVLGLLALPPGMQASGLVHVRRGDGAVVDVAAVAGSGYAFGGLADLEVLDRFARSAGVVGDPVPVAVGGRTGVVVRTASQKTVYAWMPCRNLVEVVIGADAAMAADVTARVAG